MKKTHYRLGGVAKVVFGVPTLGADQKKMTTMQHGSAKKMCFDNSRARTSVLKIVKMLFKFVGNLKTS